MLQFVDIHDALEAEFLEVEPVSLVEVSGDSFWVVVDHDGPLAHIAELASTSDRAPVELDTASNAVDTTSQNHSSMFIKFDVVLGGVVGGIKVVSVGRVFSGESVNAFDERSDSE